MPLPANFSPWEHLQSTVSHVQNRIVRQEFNDLGEDWDDDISTPRGSLRIACTHRDDDSAIMTLVRMWFFYGSLRKAQDFQAPLYGIPVATYQETVKFLPQCTLYFQQDLDGTPDDKEPLRSQITFRITGEESNTFTETNARTLANQIRTELATGTAYRWNRGRSYCKYWDMKNGYNLRLFPFSEAEGKEVIRKVLSIRNHTYNDDHFSHSTSGESFPTNPGVQYLYGKSRLKPRKRPVGYVRFRYATLKLHGLQRDVCLVDTTGRYRDALVQIDRL